MELVFRTSIVLLVAWGGSRLLWRASAATRHLLWHAALLVVLAAPILAPIAPRIALPGLETASGALQSGLATALPIRTAPIAAMPAGPIEPRTPPTSDEIAAWTTATGWVWAAGSAAMGLWFAAGWALAWLSARRAADVPGAWRQEATDLAARLGIRRDVRLGILDEDASPVTVGLCSPRILLPPCAMSWEPADRRAVLLHELAHVRRHDLGIHVVTQAACALYWFNPLVWLAARALKRERERACDDEVIGHGARPSAYAACLLNVARLARRRAPSGALAMARASELEGRLLALVDDRARKASRMGRGLAILATVFAATVILCAGPAPASTAPFRSSIPSARAVVPWSAASTLDDRPGLSERARQAATTLGTSPDAAARERAALALAGHATSRSIDVLVSALDDPSRDVREKAALALAMQSGIDVVDPLIRALSDSDSQVREKAALGLAFRRDSRVVEPLLAAMSDADAQVREKAALALGTTGDARARAALEAATRDPDAQVREKAITGLTLLDSPAAIHEAAELRNGLRAVVGALMGVFR